MLGFFQAGSAQQQMEEQARQFALAQATQAYLAQQMGLPGNVSPQAVQAYQGEDQRQMLAGNQDRRAAAQEGRAATDWQDERNYIERFLGALPQQTDPFLGAVQQGGGRMGAATLTEQLGGDRTRQQQFGHEEKLTGMRNAAELEKTRQAYAIRDKSDLAQLEAKRKYQLEDRGTALQAVQDFMGGNPVALFGMYPELVGSQGATDYSMYMQDHAAKVAAAKQAEADRARMLAGLNGGGNQQAGPILPAPQRAQIQAAREQAAFRAQGYDMLDPRVAVERAIRGEDILAENYARATWPDIYKEMVNSVLLQRQQEQQRQQELQFQQQLREASMTPQEKAARAYATNPMMY